MSARAYRLYLAACVVAGIGLCVLLVRVQGAADRFTTSAQHTAAVQADRDQMALALQAAQARITTLELALAQARAPAIGPATVMLDPATGLRSAVCLSADGRMWRARGDGNCYGQDKPQ